jgi:hypothetical protein
MRTRLVPALSAGTLPPQVNPRRRHCAPLGAIHRIVLQVFALSRSEAGGVGCSLKPGRTPERILEGFVECVFLLPALALVASAIVLLRFALQLRNRSISLTHHAPSRRTRLGDDSNALLLLRFLRRARSRRQLQHSRLLTRTETSEQRNLPVGKLECVVMHVRLILLDLPEPSHN